MKRKIQFTLFNIMLVCSFVFAQKGKYIITGKVLEQNSATPLEYATVALHDKETKNIIEGTATEADGTFLLMTENLEVYVELSFIGFQTKRIEAFEAKGNKINLGDVLVLQDGEVLSEVEVTAERSTTEFKLDKRVFNVGSDLSSTGASALEVLNNVPSVNVNIEGQISLRGSTGVQVLINGKPSVLSEEGGALGTITADMIEKVEVITNPSAKYDAEGTSGIINIVLKKEEQKGLNGSISLNTGVPHNHSIGVSLNRRTKKFNLFSQFGGGYRSLPRERESRITNLTTLEEVRSVGTEYRNEGFLNLTLGSDYYINEKNIITLSGSFAYEIERQPSETDFTFSDEDGIYAQWKREEYTEATNPKWQYDLQYKKEFEDDKEHTLIFSMLGNFFGKDLDSEFTNTNIIGSEALGDQLTRTNFKEAGYTIKADYVKPFGEKWKLEAGSQYVIQDVSNDFAVDDFVNGNFEPNPDFTNIFSYDQSVLGIYGTGAYETDKWGLKVGLRMENTNLKTLLETTNEDNNQNYTNLFPSVHTSYKFSERVSIQAGYSRRIYRPRLWDLNPFFNIRNNFNISTGNPDLLPELTDSYEITSIYILGDLSLNAAVFYRFTDGVIERVSLFENNVSRSMPMNIGTNSAVGLELNAKYIPMKWLTLNTDWNFRYFNRQGEFEGTSFDFNANVWSGRLVSKFSLPKDFDIEITGRYRSREITVQREQEDQLFMDFGARKKILKGKIVLSLSIQDAFASRINESLLLQDNFENYNRNLRGRFIRFGVSYGFGKGEAMEYSGRRR